jgi:hypothetical protein
MDVGYSPIELLTLTPTLIAIASHRTVGFLVFHLIRRWQKTSRVMHTWYARSVSVDQLKITVELQLTATQITIYH